MNDRSLLGPIDVDDAALAAMAAAQLEHPPGTVRLLDSTAAVAAYDLPALTTAGRYRVDGHVDTPAGRSAFRLYVKHIQAWTRSPLFSHVPDDLYEAAAVSVPWRTEALIYRSDLADRLPAGLRMSTARAVVDLDEDSAAIWLDEITVWDHQWTEADYTRAAYLCGRLAASPRVRELAAIGEDDLRRSPRMYAGLRLAGQIVPMLRDDEVWRHPLFEDVFGGPLRDRLIDAAAHVPDYLDELDRVPLGTAHGDFCPNNLLHAADGEGIFLIDFGFWSTQQLGFDLGQLVLGDVQVGRRPARSLAASDAECLTEYLRGLHDEGVRVEPETVRRSHALLMLLYGGLSAPPFEQLDLPVTAESRRIAHERAAIATFVLDLVDATQQIPLAAGRGTL